MKPDVPNINTIRVNGKLSSGAQIITEEFNKNFVSDVQNNHLVNATSNHENPMPYLSSADNQPFPSIIIIIIIIFIIIYLSSVDPYIG
jgi:hypothetical protein